MKKQQQIINTETGEVLSSKAIEGNGNFVQLYRSGITPLINIAEKNPQAVRLFLFFIKEMNGKNALIASVRVLAEVLNVSEKSIKNWVKFLKENNFIDIAKSGTSNVYFINSTIAWTSTAAGKKYSNFSAQVLISESEQVNLKSTFNKKIDIVK